jgi:hypothetical protein
MKRLIVLALLPLFLFGCKIKSYEERQRDEINEGKTRLIDQIIDADKHKSTYEILAIYKYRYALADVIDKVAIKDGWDLVGGMQIESNGRDSIYSSYMQTIKKVDKTLSVYRLENGNLALSKTAETK